MGMQGLAGCPVAEWVKKEGRKRGRKEKRKGKE